MGRQGSRQQKKRRKKARPLPKVHGNPGELWGDVPTPWSAGENLQRWVGAAGPKAQSAYFRRHPRAGFAFRIAALATLLGAVGAAIVLVVF
jgi:hypothetical protein